MERKVYPSDVKDEEWAFAAPYLTLMTEDAPLWVYSLRGIFNDLRWIVRVVATWHMLLKVLFSFAAMMPITLPA